MHEFRAALAGSPLPGGATLYPSAPHLLDRCWQATFSARGGSRAGKAGDGLMLARSQPRPVETPNANLPDLQHPVVDAYLNALPHDITPRIMVSRTLFVADSREEARRYADIGLRKSARALAKGGFDSSNDSIDSLIAATDTHLGTVEDVLESLSLDNVLPRATDLVFQVHSIDPPHELTLRSIELIATKIAPRLGWTNADTAQLPRLSVVH